MITDEVLYTDGQDVVVTPSTLKIRGTDYTLLGITKHGMAVIRAERWPGVLMLVLGIGLATVGIAELIPSSFIADVAINDTYMTANRLAVWIGGAIAVIGLLVLMLVKQRYAVRIATAEGEKNVVVSNKQEYINQIIDALNRAFLEVDVRKSHVNKTIYI